MYPLRYKQLLAELSPGRPVTSPLRNLPHLLIGWTAGVLFVAAVVYGTHRLAVWIDS